MRFLIFVGFCLILGCGGGSAEPPVDHSPAADAASAGADATQSAGNDEG